MDHALVKLAAAIDWRFLAFSKSGLARSMTTALAGRRCRPG